MVSDKSLVPAERIERSILVIRGQKVIMDADLARLYGAETGVLNRAVKRNHERFPKDFMFQLSEKEYAILKCQSGISSYWGGRRGLPYAFTEHGAVMAATVLNTPRAIEISVYVVRAFIKLREILATHKELAQKLNELERRLDTHDDAIQKILAALRELMKPPAEKSKEIGFRVKSGSPARSGPKPESRGQR